MTDVVARMVAVLLVSFRLAPTFAFAQPFTLLRVPATVRLLLAIMLAAWIVAGHPASTWRLLNSADFLPAQVASELLLGVTFALVLQLGFAAMLTAGRVIDIQAGFGLAVLVDPTTKNQLPLVGTLFAYAAAAIFFAIGGPSDVLAVWSQSVDAMPLGTAMAWQHPAPMIAYCSAVFLAAFGLAGLIMLTLFVLDLAIAFLSRTLPQMNVMLLGFQVKAMATLIVLPITLSLSGALMARILRMAIEAMANIG